MNPLQEYPHLFANMKFKVDTHYSVGHRIIGVIAQESFYLEDKVEEEVFIENIKNCTLIARPIKSMSDQEHKQYAEYHQKYLIRNWASLPWWQVMNLLSIGVYPFNQSDFGETVIDSTTL